MLVEWEKRPTTRALARSMRASNRVTRTMIDEHRLLYEDLAEIWSTPDETAVVLTHKKDPVWQLWLHDPDTNWQFTSVHKSLSEAQKVAQSRLPKQTPPGTYLVAQKGNGRVIKVLCTSEEGPKVLTSIFEKMDYAVRMEEVA